MRDDRGMAVDAKIEEAVRIGEKNLRTVQLVQNWCAHVSVKKAGGVGMVEQMYGVPVGPHGLECPHAPAGGIATWDLVDAALDFHDRNCVGCQFRKPVGIPNLSQLVAEQDQRAAARKQDEDRAARERAERLARREAARQKIRQTLDPVAATTLDLISELDRSEGSDPGDRLVESARLAPETFTPEIQEHLFELVELRPRGGGRRGGSVR